MSYVFPGAQTLSAKQITQEWENAGAPANVASVFGNQLTTAEGGGNSGVLYNTAYPSLPGYTPVLAGNQPEYSVGIYGENIYGDLGQPSPSQAFAIGQKLTKNPQYQTDVAAQMFSQRGFEPWGGDSYVKSFGGGFPQDAANALHSLGYSSPPQIKGGTAFTANIPAPGKSAKIATSSKVTSKGAKKPTTTTTTAPASIWTQITRTMPGHSSTPAPSQSSGLFGISWTWILVIVGVALLVWGSRHAAGDAIKVAPEVAA